MFNHKGLGKGFAHDDGPDQWINSLMESLFEGITGRWEKLGDVAKLEEAGHWGQVFEGHILSLAHLLQPGCNEVRRFPLPCPSTKKFLPCCGPKSNGASLPRMETSETLISNKHSLFKVISFTNEKLTNTPNDLQYGKKKAMAKE
jgi:hypothetical protein